MLGFLQQVNSPSFFINTSNAADRVSILAHKLHTCFSANKLFLFFSFYNGYSNILRITDNIIICKFSFKNKCFSYTFIQNIFILKLLLFLKKFCIFLFNRMFSYKQFTINWFSLTYSKRSTNALSV